MKHKVDPVIALFWLVLIVANIVIWGVVLKAVF